MAVGDEDGVGREGAEAAGVFEADVERGGDGVCGSGGGGEVGCIGVSADVC